MITYMNLMDRKKPFLYYHKHKRLQFAKHWWGRSWNRVQMTPRLSFLRLWCKKKQQKKGECVGKHHMSTVMYGRGSVIPFLMLFLPKEGKGNLVKEHKLFEIPGHFI
ncbi:hypothetical protein GOODEAATRI_030169 [Goodea atripinnis]|uniref:Uncharacterized protein n=1 Tax=Goodea atripinnis TaxID=208336 RepID=A0ABV0MLZ8_9TELE